MTYNGNRNINCSLKAKAHPNNIKDNGYFSFKRKMRDNITKLE